MTIGDREQFRATILDPEAWKRSARALIETAKTLEPKIDEFWQARRTGCSWDDSIIAVYFMLCSFALENLLKSRIVGNRRSEIADALESSSKLPRELRNHDLYDLMRKAGRNDLAEEQESLLHRLTRSAVWYGRYPVPVDAPKLSRLRKSRHMDFQISLTQYSSADRDDINRLLQELG